MTQSFRPHYGPGVASNSNRNEYQWYLPGGGGGRADNLATFMRRLPRNAGSPTLLEPSEPVQAHYRDCFTFTYTFKPCGCPATVLFTHIVMFIDVGTRRNSPTKRNNDLQQCHSERLTCRRKVLRLFCLNSVQEPSY
jgi:hypothetical protein